MPEGMEKPMKNTITLRKRQGGAVAIIVGLSLVVLIGFLGLVIDLGRTYVLKTELQNAADAAALAGASQLDGTHGGVSAAIQAAKDTASQNNYLFSQPVDFLSENDPTQLMIGTCPDETCMVPAKDAAASDAMAANRLFFRVDTKPQTLETYLMRVLNIFQTQADGIAVAGRTKTAITPLAVCSVELTECPSETNPTGTCGYRTGMAYNVRELNPISPGDAYWIDPVSAPPGVCDPSSSSTSNSLPFMCKGEVSFTVTVPGTVFTNTGVSTPQVNALNSRFNDYPSNAKCDPATAPPDANIREYAQNDTVLFSTTPPAICGEGTPGCSWLNPVPVEQSARCTGSVDHLTCDYTSHVAWAASRPTASPPAGAPATVSGTYPADPNTPFTTNNTRYFEAPTPSSRPTLAGRRYLNLLIVDCRNAGGACREVPVVGVAQFFMSVRAGRKLGSDSRPTVYVEFSRMLSLGEIQGRDIRLYR